NEFCTIPRYFWRCEQWGGLNDLALDTNVACGMACCYSCRACRSGLRRGESLIRATWTGSSSGKGGLRNGTWPRKFQPEAERFLFPYFLFNEYREFEGWGPWRTRSIIKFAANPDLGAGRHLAF